MFLRLLIAVFITGAVFVSGGNPVYAAPYPSVACSADLVSRYSCNVCFDGGYLYN